MRNAILLLGIVLLAAQCGQNEKEVVGGNPVPSYTDTITPDSAMMAYADYDKLRDSLIAFLVQSNRADDTMFIVKGFSLEEDEILAMAARLKEHPGTDTVFGMLGLRPNQSTRELQTSIIFQEKTSTFDSWTFYDYSRPCPPDCPVTH